MSLILATILPNVAIGAAESLMDASKAAADDTPVFRSKVTVWSPAWILIGIALVWLVASKGGRK